MTPLLPRGFDTTRLRVRPVAAVIEGLGAETAALLTPEVLAHLPPGLALPPGAPREAAAAWLADRLGECELLALRLAPEHGDAGAGRLAGFLLLARPDSGSCHLGYLLGRDHWGQGLASELIAGLVAALQAAGAGGLQLRGGVSASNPASARVLVKAGFAPEGPPDDAGMRSYLLTLPGPGPA